MCLFFELNLSHDYFKTGNWKITVVQILFFIKCRFTSFPLISTCIYVSKRLAISLNTRFAGPHRLSSVIEKPRYIYTANLLYDCTISDHWTVYISWFAESHCHRFLYIHFHSVFFTNIFTFTCSGSRGGTGEGVICESGGGVCRQWFDIMAWNEPRLRRCVEEPRPLVLCT